MKRSCQRHTQFFDLPVRRMISLVPTPSALNRTISARQTCLCGLLRSRASAFRRRRSAGLRVMEIPVRMRQTRMHSGPRESPPGFKCQTRSTRTTEPMLLNALMVGGKLYLLALDAGEAEVHAPRGGAGTVDVYALVFHSETDVRPTCLFRSR